MAAAAEAKVTADPGRDRGRQAPGEGVGTDGRERGQIAALRPPQHHSGLTFGNVLAAERVGDDLPHVRPANPQRVRAGDVAGQGVPDDHAGAVAVETCPGGEAGGCQRPRRGLEREPVSRIGGDVVGVLDAERPPLEAPAFEYRRPGAVGSVRGRPVRLVIVAEVDAARGEAPERLPAGEDRVQERGRVIGIREPAGEADNGDRRRGPHDSGRVSHGGACQCRSAAASYPECALSECCE